MMNNSASTTPSTPTNHYDRIRDNSRYLQELMQEMQMMTQIYEKNSSAKFKNSYNLLLREIQRIWSIELSADSPKSPESTFSPVSNISNTSLDHNSTLGDCSLFTSPITNRLLNLNLNTPEPSRDRSKPSGDTNTPQKCEKRDRVFFPNEDDMNSNLVGRIIGPRGMTIRQLEKDYDCSIYIRGKGCLRDDEKEKQLRGKVGWEHLKEKLHVLLLAKGETGEKCDQKLAAGRKRIESLLTNPDDILKKRQLLQLAVIEGTLRE